MGRISEARPTLAALDVAYAVRSPAPSRDVNHTLVWSTAPLRQDMLDAVMAAVERDRDRRTAHGDLSRMRQRFGTLSAREQQVMLLVTAGKMNKQIAGDLGISEVTVEIHRGAATRKMGARTLAALVRMAEVIKPEPSEGVVLVYNFPPPLLMPQPPTSRLRPAPGERMVCARRAPNRGDRR